MKIRVSIKWTETAKAALKGLPRKVRRGLLEKADELLDCDPREVHKPLTGSLQRYRRITYGRYRALYTVEEEEIASGDVLLHLKVLFIIAGIRKARDKNDVYRVAEKLVKLVLDDGETLEELKDVDDP